MNASLFPSTNSAVMSECGAYRYRLVRYLYGPRTLAVCMVNPSTATAETNDPTIRRVIAFARAWGFGRLIVVNLFGYRATDVRDLARVVDPIGPENDAAIVAAAAEAEMIVVAWGVRSKLPAAHRTRGEAVLDLLAGRDVHCIRTTADGSPEHPLFLPGDLRPVLYRGMTAQPTTTAPASPNAEHSAQHAATITEKEDTVDG